MPSVIELHLLLKSKDPPLAIIWSMFAGQTKICMNARPHARVISISRSLLMSAVLYYLPAGRPNHLHMTLVVLCFTPGGNSGQLIWVYIRTITGSAYAKHVKIYNGATPSHPYLYNCDGPVHKVLWYYSPQIGRSAVTETMNGPK